MTAAKKWKNTAFFSSCLKSEYLWLKNDSLRKKEILKNLQHKKSHTDVRFRFRDFLQYVTVPPDFSERVYVPSES